MPSSHPFHIIPCSLAHAHTRLCDITVSATNSHGIFRRTMQSKDNVLSDLTPAPTYESTSEPETGRRQFNDCFKHSDLLKAATIEHIRTCTPRSVSHERTNASIIIVRLRKVRSGDGTYTTRGQYTNNVPALLRFVLLTFNCEPFNRSNIGIRHWSWNYRGCWHQACPPVGSR